MARSYCKNVLNWESLRRANSGHCFLDKLDGKLFLLLLLVVIASLFGVTAYRIMRNPKLRRMWPITVFDFDEPQFSKRSSVVVGLAVALPFLVHAYFDNWEHFYCVMREGDQFYLEYLCPQRTIKLSDVNELKISIENEFRKGASYRIKINDSNHGEYTSQVMNASELDVNLQKLKAAIESSRAMNKKK